MRISSGLTVSVAATDRWFDDIRAGRAFRGYDSITAAAGQLPYVQLFNPVASGKIAIARFPEITSAAAQTVEIAFFDTALALLGPATAKGNLLAGGADPASEIRRESNAGILGDAFASYDVLASVLVRATEEWTIELGAGEGVLVRGRTVATGIRVAYSWIEL
ncbi:MAG: hypothetical protein ACREJ6_02140 [Candidatus Methylomirabilis sp.]